MELSKLEKQPNRSRSLSQPDGKGSVVYRFFELGGKWSFHCDPPEPYSWSGHLPPAHMYRVMRVSVEFEDNAKMECIIDCFSIAELSERVGYRETKITNVFVEEIAITREELEGVKEVCLTNLESLTA